jgi:hypothetical protein
VAWRACGARAARAYGPSADRAKVPPARTLEPLAFDEKSTSLYTPNLSKKITSGFFIES